MEFIFNIEPPTPEEIENKKRKGSARSSRPVRERLGGQNMYASWAATGVIVAVVVWCFYFFAPLTYGKPGLDVPQVLARKWLNYDLHFAK